jgi:hypothetical protein
MEFTFFEALFLSFFPLIGLVVIGTLEDFLR